MTGDVVTAEAASGVGERTIHDPGNKEALLLWHRVMIESVKGGDFDLSARQMALMLTVYMEEGPHMVRSLAACMGVSKPAVCRALDALSKQELIQRRVDKNDRRNVFIEPTEKGFSFLSQFSETIMDSLAAIG